VVLRIMLLALENPSRIQIRLDVIAGEYQEPSA